MSAHANPNPSAADLMSKQTFSPLVLWFPSPFQLLMPEKHGRQKRFSARTNIGDMPLPSSADNPSGQRSRPGSFGRSRSSELKVELDARIASLRQNSASFDQGVNWNSKKRAAEETLYEQHVPNKRHKSAAAMAVEKVLKTVQRGSTMAYDAFQTYKMKLTNRLTYQTAWQKDQSKKMRGCGVDFEPISDFAGGEDFGSLSPKISGKYRDNVCKGDYNNEKSQSGHSSGFKLPRIDSENWYWVSHDLRVTVISAVQLNRQSTSKSYRSLQKPRRKNNPHKLIS